jgi:hypothetical protein
VVSASSGLLNNDPQGALMSNRVRIFLALTMGLATAAPVAAASAHQRERRREQNRGLSSIRLSVRTTATAAIAVAGFLLAPAGLAVASASAATLNVCPHGCAYSQAAAAVAAAGNGDTVNVAAGTYQGGFTIDKSLTLNGAGDRRTTISGGGPVLTIGSSDAAPTVTLANLTIAGGDTTTDPQAPNCGPDVPTCGPGYTTATALGGGIEAFQGTTVTILDSAITGNRAAPSTSVPSVHAVCPGDVPCPASFGGAAGIDDWGAMRLIGTTVSDNYAAGNQSDGGGIAVESGASLSLADSTVTGNTVSAAPPTGRFAAGGGIFVDGGGSLTVDGSSIDGNSANLSNSIATPYPEQTGSTDVENSFGGGINLGNSATATISNSELDRNSVSIDTPRGQAYGGDPALAAGGPLTLQNAQVEDNSDTVNVFSSDVNGVSGPSAFEADSSATITGVEVVGNRMTITTPNSDAAAAGAVGFFAAPAAATMTDSIVADNTATANAPNKTATVQGAGIINDSDLTLTNVLVRDNKATANGMSGFAQGGGIWNGSIFGGPTPPLALDHSGVFGNTVSGSPGVTLQGGGIFTIGSPLTLTDSLVAHNTPDQCAGAPC